MKKPPGITLHELLQLAGAYEDALRAGDPITETALMTIQAITKKDPDLVKFFCDRFNGTAALHEVESEKSNEAARKLMETSRAIEKNLLETMQENKIQEVRGETWTAKLVALDDYDIDYKSVVAENPEFVVQIRAIDQEKFLKALESKQEIKGITRKTKQELKFEVNKREASPHH